MASIFEFLFNPFSFVENCLIYGCNDGQTISILFQLFLLFNPVTIDNDFKIKTFDKSLKSSIIFARSYGLNIKYDEYNYNEGENSIEILNINFRKNLPYCSDYKNCFFELKIKSLIIDNSNDSMKLSINGMELNPNSIKKLYTENYISEELFQIYKIIQNYSSEIKLNLVIDLDYRFSRDDFSTKLLLKIDNLFSVKLETLLSDFESLRQFGKRYDPLFGNYSSQMYLDEFHFSYNDEGLIDFVENNEDLILNALSRNINRLEKFKIESSGGMYNFLQNELIFSIDEEINSLRIIETDLLDINTVDKIETSSDYINKLTTIREFIKNPKYIKCETMQPISVFLDQYFYEVYFKTLPEFVFNMLCTDLIIEK